MCKSSNYLNPNIRFLMNDRCYHKMCESCVSRLFGSGPNNCPVIGCGHRLHVRNFRKQLFGDVSVEREVDVRKRLFKIFNAREEDFATLREWNDYLESVETYCFNLVNAVDVEDTEAKIHAYEAQERDSIQNNAARTAEERTARKAIEEADERLKRIAREAALQEAEEEKNEAVALKVAQMDAIARGDVDAVEKLRTESEQRVAARRAAIREEERNARALRDQQDLYLQGVMRGEKMGKEDEDEKPFVWSPTCGWERASEVWWSPLDKYEGSRLAQAQKDRHVKAGGWLVQEYAEYRLTEAFAGLTCFRTAGQEKEDEEAETERIRDRTDIMVLDAVS